MVVGIQDSDRHNRHDMTRSRSRLHSPHYYLNRHYRRTRSLISTTIMMAMAIPMSRMIRILRKVNLMAPMRTIHRHRFRCSSI